MKVSKKMAVAIGAMLLVMLLPATIASAPLSKVVLTITNTEPASEVSGNFGFHRIGSDYTSFELQGRGERVWTFTVRAGSSTLWVYYEYPDFDPYLRYLSFDIDVPFAGTEEVVVSLQYSSWWG
jgi:hypothetical protein